MSSELQSKPGSFSQSHPVAAYFLLTFTISWLGAFAVAAPHLLHHESLPKITGILMFTAMLLGPSLSAVFLTGIVAGKTGFFRTTIRWWRVSCSDCSGVYGTCRW